jgi:hypothetical protein
LCTHKEKRQPVRKFLDQSRKPFSLSAGLQKEQFAAMANSEEAMLLGSAEKKLFFPVDFFYFARRTSESIQVHCSTKFPRQRKGLQ